MKRMALFLALAVCSCSSADPDEETGGSKGAEGDVTAPAFAHSLAASEIHALEQRANRGDVASALALANHYAYSEMNHDVAKRWYRLAADGGNVSAMQAMAIYLSKSGPGPDCEAAIAWIKEAIEHSRNEKMIRDFQLRESLADLEKTDCETKDI